MITENLSTLKIHKLTQEQYNRELANGNLDDSALYLTPDEANDKIVLIDTETGAPYQLTVKNGQLELVAITNQ